MSGLVAVAMFQRMPPGSDGSSSHVAEEQVPPASRPDRGLVLHSPRRLGEDRVVELRPVDRRSGRPGDDAGVVGSHRRDATGRRRGGRAVPRMGRRPHGTGGAPGEQRSDQDGGPPTRAEVDPYGRALRRPRGRPPWSPRTRCGRTAPDDEEPVPIGGHLPRRCSQRTRGRTDHRSFIVAHERGSVHLVPHPRWSCRHPPDPGGAARFSIDAVAEPHLLGVGAPRIG